MAQRVSACPPAKPDRTLTALVMGVAVLGVCAVLAAGMLSEMLLAAALGGALALFLTPTAPWLTLGYLALVLGLGVPLSDYPVDAGPFKLYGADAIAVMLGWAGLFFAWRMIQPREQARPFPVFERVLVAILAVSCAYGVFLMAYGLKVKGYPYDEVFGDYRRMYFYALAFVVPLWIPLTETHLRKAKYAILAAGCIVILLGTYRIAMGNPVREDINLATGHAGARMLAVVEILTGALFLVYLVAMLRLSRNVLMKACAIFLAGMMAVLLLLSGFRLGTIFMVGAPILGLVLVTWINRDHLWNLVKLGLLVAVIAAPAAVLGSVVFRDQLDKMLYDMQVRKMDDAVTGDYRQWTWTSAMKLFKKHPVIGMGLGHELIFTNRTRAGVFEQRKASAHSTLMWVLYRTGLVGMGFFLAFHGSFVYYFWRKARGMPSEYQALAVGLFGGYLCMLGGSFLEPLHVAGYIAIHLVMGFCVLLLRTSGEPGSVSADPA